jgi:hypothetical protein
VTYTGNGGANRAISHSLGSTPGCFIVKRTDTGGTWAVWHRSLGDDYYLALESTQQAYPSSILVRSATSTTFSVGSDATVNASGGTYVCYLFAHDAGGFGLSGAENVISCGTGTWNGSGVSSVTLGYEPQWVMIKASTDTAGWWMVDNMRGMPATNDGAQLNAELDIAENTASSLVAKPTATGFTTGNGLASNTYIYIAIRRGPMKVPTDGTKVFIPSTWTGNGNTGRTISSLTSPVDLAIVSALNSQSPKLLFSDRLRGSGTGENSGNMRTLTSTSTVAESNSSLNGYYATLDYQDSVRLLGSSTGIYNNGGTGNLLYAFKRAPGFFDEVCYTGTGSNLTLPHNLTVAPELIIAKVRSTSSSWGVSTSADWTKYLLLNSTNAQASASLFGTPDATNFYPTASGGFSGSGNTYVAYLFATCAGVSKVGSYTGTATTLQIDCGFTAGSRFVLIKRTDSTGDWYVWDSARGIVAGNDPYLLLNSTAAEVTNTDYVDTYNAGFEISSTAPAGINANGGTYIFLAIA